MSRVSSLIGLAVIASMCSFVASASDIAREKRLHDEIIDSILDGDPVYLDAAGHEFLAIEMEAESDPTRGAVIILHGRGYHPDWEDVVQPLRVGLTTHGWSTLSLQMPVLDKQAKYFDYLEIMDEVHPRIEAAIAHLKESDTKRVILIAHSCSVHMAIDWFHDRDWTSIDGFVGIGMGATDFKQPMMQSYPFGEMNIPILDVYGADEYTAVINGAPARMSLIRKGGDERSSQIVIPGADHDFKGRGKALTDAVAGWLDKIAPE